MSDGDGFCTASTDVGNVDACDRVREFTDEQVQGYDAVTSVDVRKSYGVGFGTVAKDVVPNDGAANGVPNVGPSRDESVNVKGPYEVGLVFQDDGIFKMADGPKVSVVPVDWKTFGTHSGVVVGRDIVDNEKRIAYDTVTSVIVLNGQ